MWVIIDEYSDASERRAVAVSDGTKLTQTMKGVEDSLTTVARPTMAAFDHEFTDDL
jgi:hypothetical protein